MTDYREADFSRLKTVPIAQRRNKVEPSLLAHPPGADSSFAVEKVWSESMMRTSGASSLTEAKTGSS